MNLKLLLPIKKIDINGKEVVIPKLGIKHYQLTKNIENPVEILDVIVKSIEPGLSLAEYDYMILHLLEFNFKIKSEVEYNGQTLYLKDVYISQKLNFTYQGNEYIFNSPDRLISGTADQILAETYTGNAGEVDFLEMPAFVSKWLKSMTDTLSIKTNNGIISGAAKIMDLFKDGKEQ